MRKNFIALFFTMLLVGVVVSCSDNVDFDENQSDEVLNSNISSSDLLMNLERSFLPATRANAALDPELYVYPDYYCGNYMKGDKVVILVKGDKVDVRAITRGCKKLHPLVIGAYLCQYQAPVLFVVCSIVP